MPRSVVDDDAATPFAAGAQAICAEIGECQGSFGLVVIDGREKFPGEN
jgi:hypothetical protein